MPLWALLLWHLSPPDASSPTATGTSWVPTSTTTSAFFPSTTRFPAGQLPATCTRAVPDISTTTYLPGGLCLPLPAATTTHLPNVTNSSLLRLQTINQHTKKTTNPTPTNTYLDIFCLMVQRSPQWSAFYPSNKVFCPVAQPSLLRTMAFPMVCLYPTCG